jgi:hypothetical protein
MIHPWTLLHQRFGQIVKAMAFFEKVFPFSKRSSVLLESGNHLFNSLKASRRMSMDVFTDR